MRISNNKFRTLLFTAALIGSPFLGACSSYQNIDDFSEMQKRAAAGEGAAVAQEILKNWEQIPPGRYDDAIDTLASINGNDGFQALQMVLDKPGIEEQHKKRVMSHMIRREDPGAPEFLLNMASKNPALVSEPLVQFFGKTKHAP